ncbi:hypothetical protein [Anaeroselena agilis]|uniref:Uncharacterized protein n=1 Tax=Anaeroselena agilis TaxID=3063788 RepID=A0ABU3NW91_9FIRM|nr:hypothetical protein [Selenomonadales bacterium 4137-cl]
MIVGISWRIVSRRVKAALKAMALVVMVFYVLSKLLGFLWQFNQPLPKIRDDHYLEKPLRVISDYVKVI